MLTDNRVADLCRQAVSPERTTGAHHGLQVPSAKLAIAEPTKS